MTPPERARESIELDVPQPVRRSQLVHRCTTLLVGVVLTCWACYCVAAVPDYVRQNGAATMEQTFAVTGAVWLALSAALCMSGLCLRDRLVWDSVWLGALGGLVGVVPGAALPLGDFDRNEWIVWASPLLMSLVGAQLLSAAAILWSLYTQGRYGEGRPTPSTGR